jgi:hypothetical protein
MANSSLSSRRAGILGLGGVLPSFYQGLQRHCGSTDGTTKEGFKWAPSAEEAFRALQQALTMAPVLQLPDFTIECDASGSVLGAVLHQGAGPIAFINRPLVPRHSKLVAYECELIG